MGRTGILTYYARLRTVHMLLLALFLAAVLAAPAAESGNGQVRQKQQELLTDYQPGIPPVTIEQRAKHSGGNQVSEVLSNRMVGMIPGCVRAIARRARCETRCDTLLPRHLVYTLITCSDL